MVRADPADPGGGVDRAARLGTARSVALVVGRLLDLIDEAIDDCATYFNGEGCSLADSLMSGWISEFWDPGVLATVDPVEAAGLTPLANNFAVCGT